MEGLFILPVKLTFIEEVLGTASANKEIHREFIAEKAPDALSREEEVEYIGVDAVVEKSMTIFPKENGKPFFWDYQLKGFFKDTCGSLSRCPGTITYKGTTGKEFRAYRKIIDGCIFVQPRKIFIELNGSMGNCQRPLRGSTPQGERIALANSETVPSGSTCSFDIVCLNEAYEKYVIEWLDYGQLRGTGQWRNSGKGRFTYEINKKKRK
jgi:hypothetical protein